MENDTIRYIFYSRKGSYPHKKPEEIIQIKICGLVHVYICVVCVLT